MSQSPTPRQDDILRRAIRTINAIQVGSVERASPFQWMIDQEPPLADEETRDMQADRLFAWICSRRGSPTAARLYAELTPKLIARGEV